MHQTATSSATVPVMARHERRNLRLAGYTGLFPLIVFCALVALGRFPYPEDNVPGRKLITYVLPHRTGELQTIMWGCVLMAMLVFFVLLAVAYMRRAGRPTASSLAIITGMAAYATLELAGLGVYAGVVLWARGDPSFGSNPADLRLITFAWGSSNVMFVLGALPLAVTWTALAAANRADPLLPRALGGWCAGAVAAVNVGCLGSVFVDTGRWSPTSIYELVLQMAPIFGWMIVAAVALLRMTSERASAGALLTSRR